MPSKTRKDEEDISVDSPPTSIDVYATLELANDATQDQIRTAYRKAALKHHPDKAPSEDKATAHIKFQEVAFAYAILSDERRRKRYDATGSTEESLDLDDDDFDWATFFREQFSTAVTTQAIEEFSRSYKGSDEEKEHVLAAYTRSKGRMDEIYESVMLSDVLEDDVRFRGIIDEAIKNGEVISFKSYAQETEKSKLARIARAKKQREKEAAEVAELEDNIKSKQKGKDGKKKGSDLGDLAALIQQRQQSRANRFFDALEEKYGPKGAKRGKRSTEDEPPEEAFAANRAKRKTNSAGSAKTNKKVKR